MDFKKMRDALGKNKHLSKAWEKAVDYVVEQKTPVELAADAALGVALTVATGGAILPAIGLVAAESVAIKVWTETPLAKKLAADRRNKKSGPGKDGPKPQ